MGIFQSVGGAATSGRGFTGRQVAEALKAASEAQKQRHIDRVHTNATPTLHRRTRSTVVQTLADLDEDAFTATVEYRTTAPLEGVGSADVDVVVTEYAPDVFRYLRQLEGVAEAQFCNEWDLPVDRLNLELGEGRSMAMFLKSKSMEFMCKTISEVEVNVLLGIIRAYAGHLSQNRHSLLMRFLMLLKVEVQGEVGYILCFADIFAGCDRLNERWDIKGRRPKPGKYRQFPRWAEEQARLATAECTVKSSRTFSYEPSQTCDISLQSQMSANIPHVDKGKLLTRKDKDLTRLFWLESLEREELLDQLQQDFQFLLKCGLMDYSILIGVKYDVAGGRTKGCSPARSMRMTFALGEEDQRGCREIRDVSTRESSPEGFSFRYDPNIITHNSKYHYGVLSLQEHETYYIGIIDMLTQYNWKKKTANFCKTFLWTENTLSTIPPKAYEHRIEKYARKIFATPSTTDKLAMTQGSPES